MRSRVAATFLASTTRTARASRGTTCSDRRFRAEGTGHLHLRSSVGMSNPKRRKRRVVRALALLGVGLVAALVPASPASAHASFVEASPAPGVGLAQAAGEVVIRFTEPLVRDLSKIEVVDREGNDVTRAPTLPVEGDPQAMRRPLGLLSPGAYQVRWTTVSPLDGHTLKGRYTFAVGTAASPLDSVDDGPVDSEGWLGLAGRFTALAGLTLWAGLAFASQVALRAGVPERRLRILGRVAPTLVAAGTATALASSALVATGSLGALDTVALASNSGRLRLALVMAGVAGAAVGWARRRVSWAFAAGALLAEAASGHAASSPLPPVAIPSFAVHLAAVGVWVLGVAAALLSSRRLRSTLAAFAPYAVIAAGVVGLTGVANAFLELENLGDLTATGYGQVVVAKAVAFGTIALFGLLHHLARKRSDTPTGFLRLAVGGEAAALATRSKAEKAGGGVGAFPCQMVEETEQGDGAESDRLGDHHLPVAGGGEVTEVLQLEERVGHPGEADHAGGDDGVGGEGGEGGAQAPAWSASPG